MVKHFLEAGIQTKINVVSLVMIVDGETLERSLECLRNVKKWPSKKSVSSKRLGARGRHLHQSSVQEKRTYTCAPNILWREHQLVSIFNQKHPESSILL